MTLPPRPVETSTLSPGTTRLLSLDALRGFDMCCILGLDLILPRLAQHLAPDSQVSKFITTQWHHVEWEGLRFYDVLFPLFLFLSGVSMAISIARRKQRDGMLSTAAHLVVRGLILFFLGVIYSGGLSKFTGDLPAALEHVRWMGVLQRIALASMFAGLLSLILNVPGLIVSTVVLLVGYWVLLTRIPVPGVDPISFAEGQNLANYIDLHWLPGFKYDGPHDPEGLLSTLPAIATALLGILAGKWLFGTATPLRKTLGLLIAGTILVVLGFAWAPYFPIIKKLWTSSYVLATGGLSTIALAVFYAIIDGFHLRRWCAPLVWVGLNPITLYLFQGLGFFAIVATTLVGHPPAPWTWVLPLTEFLLILATAYWLSRRGIVIRV